MLSAPLACSQAPVLVSLLWNLRMPSASATMATRQRYLRSPEHESSLHSLPAAPLATPALKATLLSKLRYRQTSIPISHSRDAAVRHRARPARRTKNAQKQAHRTHTHLPALPPLPSQTWQAEGETASSSSRCDSEQLTQPRRTTHCYQRCTAAVGLPVPAAATSLPRPRTQSAPWPKPGPPGEPRLERPSLRRRLLRCDGHRSRRHGARTGAPARPGNSRRCDGRALTAKARTTGAGGAQCERTVRAARCCRRPPSTPARCVSGRGRPCSRARYGSARSP